MYFNYRVIDTTRLSINFIELHKKIFGYNFFVKTIVYTIHFQLL